MTPIVVVEVFVLARVEMIDIVVRGHTIEVQRPLPQHSIRQQESSP